MANGLKKFDADPKGMASRISSGTIINEIAEKLPELMGGSADLAPSNKTWINSSKAFQSDNPGGQKLAFWRTRAWHGCSGKWNGLP